MVEDDGRPCRACDHRVEEGDHSIAAVEKREFHRQRIGNANLHARRHVFTEALPVLLVERGSFQQQAAGDPAGSRLLDEFLVQRIDRVGRPRKFEVFLFHLGEHTAVFCGGLRRLRNDAQEIERPASDDKNELVQAMKLGTSGIVLKQTATELLIKSIRKVHAGEIWLDSHTTAAVIRQFVANEEAPPPPPPPAAPATSAPRDRERSPLSQREREIVALVAQGFKNKEMAEKMFISEQTVKNHLHNIFDKLGVSDRLELALYAIHNNLHTGR
jgi:DNA-binding NarL/FixJ family response regulator